MDVRYASRFVGEGGMQVSVHFKVHADLLLPSALHLII